MAKINPALRTGLMWAGAHQAICLGAIASSLWASFSDLIVLSDLPVVAMAEAFGLWRHLVGFKLADVIDELSSAPSQHPAIVVLMLVLGSLQWFLIGCAAGVRRSKREAAAVKS